MSIIYLLKHAYYTYRKMKKWFFPIKGSFYGFSLHFSSSSKIFWLMIHYCNILKSLSCIYDLSMDDHIFNISEYLL